MLANKLQKNEENHSRDLIYVNPKVVSRNSLSICPLA